jgi:hypothetical protein
MGNSTDRRSQGERRQLSKRRSHAEARRLYIELRQSTLRAAIVFDPGRGEPPQVQCRTVTWRHDATDLFSEQGRAELTVALRQLVTQDRLAGCCVSFAVSGALCVNRATSGAKTKVETELASFQERAQMYLSLGPGPKATAIGRKAIDARHEHALLTVANESTLNLLIDAAEAVGLSVDVVESALVSLARFHAATQPEEESAVILVQIDEARFEVGVSQQGQLLLEYRPSSDASPAQLGRVLDEHHDRLQRFCRRQYGLGTMSLNKLWLVGDKVEVDAADAKSKVRLTTAPLPVVGLDSFWKAPAVPFSPEYAPALGLALHGRGEAGDVSPNLMEQVHARAKTPIRPFLMRAAAPIAATLLVAAGIGGYNSHQEGELATLRETIAELAPLELRGKLLGKQILDAETELRHVAALLECSPHHSFDPVVDRLAHCLPDDVWIKQLRIDERRNAIVTGASYTEGGVYDFVHYLEQAPGFAQIALRGTGIDQTDEGPATSFDLEFALPSPATPASKEPNRG